MAILCNSQGVPGLPNVALPKTFVLAFSALGFPPRPPNASPPLPNGDAVL